ncbi:hypothetical protein MMC30_002066 [Trapelia coarctata]|nr:hypothetical protein [Trapelia coarctata]
MAFGHPRRRLRLATSFEGPVPEVGAYTYTPLKDAREIRVLKNFRMEVAVYLLDDKLEFRQELSCEVTTIGLDMSTSVPYVALSYTWGDPLPEAPADNDSDASSMSEYWIYCNGARLEVGENLHCYLQQAIAKLDHPIWIDAICIIQQDSAERNAQILVMSEIYAHAFAVFVWLGPSDTASDIA